MYLLMFARPAPPLLDAAWERTARFLGFLARTTASLGARLLVVGVCTKEQIWRHYFEQRLSKYPRLPFQFDPYYPNERLQRILAQQHIPYLDLMPIFEHNTELGQQLFFNTDLHWNERGHALAAEHIARTISTLEQEDQFANTPVGTSNHLDQASSQQ